LFYGYNPAYFLAFLSVVLDLFGNFPVKAFHSFWVSNAPELSMALDRFSSSFELEFPQY
jgi:hypothetical protein